MKEYDVLDWKVIGSELGDEVVAVLHNQELTEQELIDGCKEIGNIFAPGAYFNHPDYPEIFRVTNRKENGKFVGIFPEAELQWHNNGYLRHWRYINEAIVALYCIEPGIDSVTSFIDSQVAFDSLPFELKEEARQYEYWVEFNPNDSIYDFTEGDKELVALFQRNRYTKPSWKPLIVTHPSRTVPNWWISKEAIYLGNTFMRKLRNKETKEEYTLESKRDLIKALEEELFQTKHVYHHHWQKGDLVISDQFYSYHKRNKVKGDRLLYRLAFNYKNL